MDPPNVQIGNIEEYETESVVQEVWSGNTLVYEEIVYQAWLEIEFRNGGGIRADNVWAEVVFYNRNREVKTTIIYLPNLRSGSSYVYTLNTGFESIYDYSDYEVSVFWE